MTSTFTQVALDRIAKVVQMPAQHATPKSALDFIGEAMEDDVAAQFFNVEFSSTVFWSGSDEEPVLRFVSFSGLVELGAQSGYVDLMAWHGATALEQALRGFRAANAKADSDIIDLHLIDALLARFDATSFGARSADSGAFGTFESYLHLTGRIRSDASAIAFLLETHDRTSDDRDDLPALLSPRHFAETFATGMIGGVPVTDVSVGYRVLGYFEWLAEILESARGDVELRRGIIRHARWAQYAERVQRRFEFWAERMHEWDVSSEERASEDPWPVCATRVFGPLVSAQKAMRPPAPVRDPNVQQTGAGPSAIEEFEIPAPPAPVAERLDQLLAEGRVGAARQLALSDAVAAEKEVRLIAGKEFGRVEALVARCETLADLGGLDAAAALLAPWVPALLAEYGSEYEVVAKALAIVARAREGGAAKPNQEESRDAAAPLASQDRSVEVPREAPRHRGLGE